MKRNNRQLTVRTMVLCLLGLMMMMPQNVFAGADIKFTFKEGKMGDGFCEVRGYFINNGDMAGEITKAEITIDVKRNGTILYSVKKTFDMGHLYVWNGAPYHTFTVYDSRFKEGTECRLNWYFWWDNVKPIGN